MDIRYDDFVELLEHLAHAPEKDLPPMSVASVIKKARGTRIVDEHGLPSPIDEGELCIELMDAISWVGWEPHVKATLPPREVSWNAVKDQYPDIRVDPWGAGWGKSGKKGWKNRNGKGRSGRKSGTARRGGK